VRRHLETDDRAVLDRLSHLGRKSIHATDMASLLGVEGVAAKAYFAALAGLLKQGAPFDFEGHNRRPPRDPINALISYLAAILVKELTIALSAVGLDPMVGFYHQPRYGRPSLALDLAEEFRPLVVDSVVLTLVNHGEIGEGHFVRRAGAVALTPPGRKAVIAAFERRMDTLVTHPVFRYRVSYRRVLAVQSRLLARTVLGEIPEYPSFCTR
jgi:CRISPR-associated protein Cas1